MKLTRDELERLAAECSMTEIEQDVYEASIDDLRSFAELVIEAYDSDDVFTSYGRKEDWD